MVAEKSYLDAAFGSVTNVSVDAAALVAVGNTSTEPATYTQMFRSLAAAGTVFIVSNQVAGTPQIPAGASSFRLIGSSPDVSAGSPFVNTFDVILNQGPFPVLGLTGAELLDTLKSGSFIVLPAGIDSLEINNGTGAPVTNWGIQWGLDL